MPKELSDQEIIKRFGSKYGENGIQAYGISEYMGKKCIRVVVFRPKAGSIKLPKTFLRLKVMPIFTDAKPRAL